MALHTHYEITVQVLSPVHIGDGSELLRNLDYVTHAGHTWVVDQDRLMERVLGSSDDFDDALLGRPVSELVSSQDFEDATVFRYRMPGLPANRPIRSQIKDVYGQPYLPGSTLKGLLRTIFIWGTFVMNKQTPDLTRLGRSRSWAGQPVEREMMGGTPHEDLFRAVHVTDSLPVELDRMRVAAVAVYPTQTREGAGVVVDVEALREETVFSSRMTIDEYGFSNRDAQAKLNWTDQQRSSLDRLIRFGRAHAGERLAQEIEYFQAKGGPRHLLRFYSQLVQTYENLAENQFLAQIGWGTGWNSKTMNNLLMGDPRTFAKLVKDYRLTRFYEKFKPGDRFPASRHLMLQRDEPVRPMGWIQVTIGQLQ